MEKNGVNLEIIRQDWLTELRNLQMKFVEEYDRGNENPKEGAAGIMIMGDGVPFYISSAQQALDDKYGKGKYQLQAMGAVGLSYGEDKLIGPPSWKMNPQSMKGSLVSAVIGDGDWVTTVNYAFANGLKVNPDPSTYDADAVNFLASANDDYIESAKELIKSQNSGWTIPLKEVKNGKLTGKTINKKVDGCATWTPGDKMVFDALTGFTDVVIVCRSLRRSLPRFRLRRRRSRSRSEGALKSRPSSSKKPARWFTTGPRSGSPPHWVASTPSKRKRARASPGPPSSRAALQEMQRSLPPPARLSLRTVRATPSRLSSAAHERENGAGSTTVARAIGELQGAAGRTGLPDGGAARRDVRDGDHDGCRAAGVAHPGPARERSRADLPRRTVPRAPSACGSAGSQTRRRRRLTSSLNSGSFARNTRTRSPMASSRSWVRVVTAGPDAAGADQPQEAAAPRACSCRAAVVTQGRGSDQRHRWRHCRRHQQER